MDRRHFITGVGGVIFTPTLSDLYSPVLKKNDLLRFARTHYFDLDRGQHKVEPTEFHRLELKRILKWSYDPWFSSTKMVPKFETKTFDVGDIWVSSYKFLGWVTSPKGEYYNYIGYTKILYEPQTDFPYAPIVFWNKGRVQNWEVNT